MLTIGLADTGFGTANSDFLDCMSEHSDLDMCKLQYPGATDAIAAYESQAQGDIDVGNVSTTIVKTTCPPGYIAQFSESANANICVKVNAATPGPATVPAGSVTSPFPWTTVGLIAGALGLAAYVINKRR